MYIAESADLHMAALKVSSMSSVICHMSCWGQCQPVRSHSHYKMTCKLTSGRGCSAFVPRCIDWLGEDIILHALSRLIFCKRNEWLHFQKIFMLRYLAVAMQVKRRSKHLSLGLFEISAALAVLSRPLCRQKQPSCHRLPQAATLPCFRCAVQNKSEI